MERMSLQLKEIGVEVDSVILRLGGNEAIYLSICDKFRYDQNYQLFQTAITENDLHKAVFHIHTLKGIAANLGFNRLEQITSYIMEDLKKNDLEALQHNIKDLTEEQKKLINILDN